jgi:hypothetical protein
VVLWPSPKLPVRAGEVELSEEARSRGPLATVSSTRATGSWSTWGSSVLQVESLDRLGLGPLRDHDVPDVEPAVVLAESPRPSSPASGQRQPKQCVRCWRGLPNLDPVGRPPCISGCWLHSLSSPCDHCFIGRERGIWCEPVDHLYQCAARTPGPALCPGKGRGGGGKHVNRLGDERCSVGGVAVLCRQDKGLTVPTLPMNRSELLSSAVSASVRPASASVV